VTGENIGNISQQRAAELKRVREAEGLSQEQMAARLGLGYAPDGRKVSTPRATVSSWETGRRSPSAEQIKAYIELGGDPALLPLPEPAPRGPTAAAANLGPMPQPKPTSQPEPAGAGPAPGRRFRPWRSWPWLVVLPAAVVAAGGGAFLVVALDQGPGGPTSTWTETTGTPAHTWADATQLTGAGTPLGPRQSVQVTCRVRGYVVEDGDPWWYRLASAPWNGHYYATSDAFYNNGAVTGSVDTGVVVDEQVPVCQGS
jgi:transcriptional regulator with XRE-family HTH domain